MTATRITPRAPWEPLGPPIAGLTNEQWRALNTYAWEHQQREGMTEWPDEQAYMEREPRMCFYRYLARRGVLNEGRRWDV